jgi:hypothetical protein
LTTTVTEPRPGKPRNRRGRPPSEIAQALSEQPAANRLADEARAEYAEAMQQDAASVDFLRVNWSAVMQRGGRASISFGYWRAVRALTLEDIGLVPQTPQEREALQRVIKLPKGRLLVGREDFDPIAEAASVESRGRTLLKLYSVPTALGPYVPLGEIDDQHPEAGWHYRELKAAIAAVERDFLAVRDKMGEPEQWDALVSQTIGYWATIADRLYGDMLSAGRLPTRGDIGVRFAPRKPEFPVTEPEAASRETYLAETPSQEQWVDWFLNTRVKPFMRSREEAMASFRFAWGMQPILPPQALLQAQAEDALDAAELELRQDMLAKSRDAVDSFYRDVVGELRARLLENCTQALEAMDKNDGKLPSRTQTGIRTLIEYIEAVKVWPDSTLEGQIAEMRAALDLPVAVREVAADEIKALFRRIAAEAQLTLQELDRAEMRSSRDLKLEELGIPEDGPELEALAGRSRRTLDIGADTGPADITIARAARGRSLN